MKFLIVLFVVGFVDVVTSDCNCRTMKWATCDDLCTLCTIPFTATVNQPLNCSKLVPKCFLMKTEMYRARTGQSTRSGGKPVETAFVDNDGIYDPDCENDGKFKARQCNNTDVCWCVNSAGVRRTDKGDQNIQCEPVETYWVRLELKHKEVAVPLDAMSLRTGIQNALLQRYGMPNSFMKEFQYDQDGRVIVVDVIKPKEDRTTDLSLMTYYMEKDIKVLPLFADQQSFQVNANGTQVSMENILVYYVDVTAPTFTMQKLTGGVIAVIVVVSLIVIGGLLALYFIAQRQKAKYSKAEPREMETMS